MPDVELPFSRDEYAARLAKVRAAMDADGNYRNFLDLQAVVVGPKGERQLVPLKQTAPGRYDAAFETRETGAYLVHLREMENGELRSSQVIGANLDHSPEFAESRPNLSRLERLAEVRCPTSVLCGSRTDLAPEWFDAQAEVLGVEAQVVDGGHFFLFEDLDRAAALIRRALA